LSAVTGASGRKVSGSGRNSEIGRRTADAGIFAGNEDDSAGVGVGIESSGDIGGSADDRSGSEIAEIDRGGREAKSDLGSDGRGGIGRGPIARLSEAAFHGGGFDFVGSAGDEADDGNPGAGTPRSVSAIVGGGEGAADGIVGFDVLGGGEIVAADGGSVFGIGSVAGSI